MAQTNYTPISLYYSATATNVPTAGNLVAGELALNTADGKLFYKDSSGVVQVLATKGGVGTSSTNQVLYNSSGLVVGSAGLTFDGTNLATTGTATATRFIPSGSTIATNGLYLPAANSLGFSTNSTEAMRIDSSGNLLVGTTSASLATSGFAVIPGTSTYAGVAHASGAPSGAYYFPCVYNGSVIGSITQSGTTGVLYNVTSDYRLKTVISPVSDSGARIDLLEPIEYDWKENGKRTKGFLAHQFAEVYPDSVSGEKDAVDAEGKPVYQSMQASSTEVMADLIAEIQSLRKRVATLEAK